MDTMRRLCIGMLESHGELGLEEITKLVKKQLSNQALTEGHMKQILQTLIYDGMVRTSSSVAAILATGS